MGMIRNVTVSVSLVQLLASAPLLAEPYEFELRADYERRDSRSATSIQPADPMARSSLRVESDEFDLSGSWYWNGVDVSDGPRSRAAFLARASRLSLSVMRVSFGLDDTDAPSSLDSDSDRWSIGGTLRF